MTTRIEDCAIKKSSPEKALFKAYKTIKNAESKGKSRDEIKALLMENFGEKNPDVKVM